MSWGYDSRPHHAGSGGVRSHSRAIPEVDPGWPLVLVLQVIQNLLPDPVVLILGDQLTLQQAVELK